MKDRVVDKKVHMEYFQARMREFLFHDKCKSRRQFALKHGLGTQRFAIYMKRGNVIVPGWDFGIKLKTACPELNLNWLFTGKGKMLEGYVQRENRPEGVPYYF